VWIATYQLITRALSAQLVWLRPAHSNRSVLEYVRIARCARPSYMLPKLHEEAMALPSEEEYAERKRPEQPALATFAMPDVPPAP
ncbi:hypothetical protein MJH54_32140, partial [Salmonella enterica subsp. enterica serovar Montevideo]|nr:hypothetical protein [Salmonella enterica subsp. enterica serovar Montevideo]